jgi:damage-control phosphatase, subfamily I
MHWVYGRMSPHVDEREGTRIARTILATLMREVRPEANLGALCNDTVRDAFAFPSRATDHYEELKRQSNENAKALLPDAKGYVSASGLSAKEGFERSCFLAAASNVSPLNSPSGAYTFDEIRSIIGSGGSRPEVVGDVYDTVRKARHVLYIVDNAGEIGFDSIAIDLIKRMGPKVTLVVKEKTFFEDATLEDARFFGLDGVVDDLVPVEGFFAPAQLPRGLRDILDRCDVVIGKGTGTFEALHGEIGDKPSIYMLKVKCGPIARRTGAREGEVVIGLDAHVTRGS